MSTAAPDGSWPNALAVAADLIDARGFSPRYLEDPQSGALAVDRAVQVALGYTWKTLEGAGEDEEAGRAFVAPDKRVAKLYDQLAKELLAHLATVVEYRIPSLGFWNTQQTEPEEASRALRIAAANFEANRARVALPQPAQPVSMGRTEALRRWGAARLLEGRRYPEGTQVHVDLESVVVHLGVPWDEVDPTEPEWSGVTIEGRGTLEGRPAVFQSSIEGYLFDFEEFLGELLGAAGGTMTA